MKVSVIGSGPNGLAAAVVMARAGHDVTVYEGSDKAGGGLRTDDFTDFDGRFDVCSAVHPMALASVFFRSFDLGSRIPFVQSDISFAHALPGRAAVAYRDLERTSSELGRTGPAWSAIMKPLLHQIDAVRALSGLQLRPHPSTVAGALALGVAAMGFSALRGEARALGAGVVAHGAAPFSSIAGRFVGAVLAAEGHAAGWPIPVGGSGAIADAMVQDIEAHGGRVELGRRIEDLREVWSPGDTAMFDTGPRGFADIASNVLPARYVSALRSYRYGNAASKVDFVLSGPIPWTDARLRDALTVHLGGWEREVSGAERAALRGSVPARPYVLLSQPTRRDRTRLPPGSTDEIVWAYAHVPNGSTEDAAERIIDRIESFAPGFRDVIVHRESRPAPFFAQLNPNFQGGDILGGRVDVPQLLTRPTKSVQPWRTPIPGVYLCSAATPPGAGVHGMAGWHAARLALARVGQGLPDLRPAARVD